MDKTGLFGQYHRYLPRDALILSSPQPSRRVSSKDRVHILRKICHSSTPVYLQSRSLQQYNETAFGLVGGEECAESECWWSTARKLAVPT